MQLRPLDSADPRDVLRALRSAVLGAGPAVALGAVVDAFVAVAVLAAVAFAGVAVGIDFEPDR